MANTMYHDEAKRQFSSESIKPLIALVNIIDESKDKELVVNGLVCINLAFSYQAVVHKTMREFKDFESRINGIAGMYENELYIQNNKIQIFKQLEGAATN